MIAKILVAAGLEPCLSSPAWSGPEGLQLRAARPQPAGDLKVVNHLSSPCGINPAASPKAEGFNPQRCSYFPGDLKVAPARVGRWPLQLPTSCLEPEAPMPDLPLSGIRVLDRCHVILRSGGRRLWQSPPLPQILRCAQNDRGAAP